MKGKIIGIVIVVMLAITGAAGYFTYQKAEEKARQLAEDTIIDEENRKDEAAKTHYENKYFSIDVPEDWIGYWDVIEEENSLYVD